MYLLAVIALTCWVCTLIARPHRARDDNDVEERVYHRLLGRQHRLLLLAVTVTAFALIGALAARPAHVDPDLHALRNARARCISLLHGGLICPVLEPGGVWAQAQAQADGSWRVLPAGAATAFSPYDDPATRNR